MTIIICSALQVMDNRLVDFFSTFTALFSNKQVIHCNIGQYYISDGILTRFSEGKLWLLK